MDNGIMNAFRAEALLADSETLIRIASLRHRLTYTTQGDYTSLDDCITDLRKDVDSIPKIELEKDVSPGTENYYSSQLISAMERIVDDCDRVLRKLAHFQGRLREAERQITSLKSEFVAWYTLQANALIMGLDDKLKISAREIRGLAEAEFSRMIGMLDLKVETILEDLKLEFDKIAQHKSTQKEKLSLGKDQANASWASLLPSYGDSIPENQRTDVLNRPQEPEEEDGGIPAFISNKPRIDDVKGTFKKTLTAAATIVKDETGEPVITSRQKLIEEEEF